MSSNPDVRRRSIIVVGLATLFGLIFFFSHTSQTNASIEPLDDHNKSIASDAQGMTPDFTSDQVPHFLLNSGGIVTESTAQTENNVFKGDKGSISVEVLNYESKKTEIEAQITSKAGNRKNEN